MKTFLSLSAFLLLFLITSCKKECSNISIHEAYKQAVMYPERFDTWVAQNSGSLDAEFNKCLDHLISLNWDIVKEQEGLCFDAHGGDSDRLSSCLQEVSANFGGYLSTLMAIKRTARGQVAFFETPTGAALISVKQVTGATTYEQLMGSVVDAAIPFNTCEVCN